MIRNPFKKKTPGIDIDHEFTRGLFEEQQAKNNQLAAQKTAAMKDEVQAMRREQLDKAGEEAWKKVNENIQRMSEGRSEAYVGWETGMNSLAGYARDFAYALAAHWGNVDLPNPSWDKSKTDKLNVLPNVGYSVVMDDTGHIQTTVEIDNETAGAEHKKRFDFALQAWAKENGCTLQQDFTFKNDLTGELLDKDAFDNLKHDPTHGLHSYLSDKFAMELEDRSSLQP